MAAGWSPAGSKGAFNSNFMSGGYIYQGWVFEKTKWGWGQRQDSPLVVGGNGLDPFIEVAQKRLHLLNGFRTNSLHLQ